MSAVSAVTATQPVAPPANPSKKAGPINAVPNVIKLEILKGLRAEELCKSVAPLNRAWHTLEQNEKPWTYLASKILAPILNPNTPKQDVIAFCQELPITYANLLRLLPQETTDKLKWSDGDNCANYQEIITAFRSQLKNKAFYEEMAKKTRDMVADLRQRLSYNSIAKAEIYVLQILLDLGVAPFEGTGAMYHTCLAGEWDHIIYHLNYLPGFKIYLEGQKTKSTIYGVGCLHHTQHFITLLQESILHGNIPFIKFLLSEIDKVQPIAGVPLDWGVIYFESWGGAIRKGLDLTNPKIEPMLKLFDKYKSIDPKRKEVLFQNNETHRQYLDQQIKTNPYNDDDEYLDEQRTELTNLEKGIPFLQKHFLPTEADTKAAASK